MKINSELIFFLLILLLIFTKSQIIDIMVTNETDKNHIKIIGPSGSFYMETDTKNLSMFNRSDMENLTKFEAEFEASDGQYFHISNCFLWSPEKMNISIICPFNSPPFNESLKYRLNSSFIIYENYYIRIDSDINYYFSFDMKEFNIPFIYALPQSINLDEAKDSYELKFKAKSYFEDKLCLASKSYNHSLSLYDYINYNTNNNELIFGISNKKIQEVMTYDKALNLALFNGELGIFNFDLVDDIQIKYTKEKKDIIFEITEALNEETEKGSFAAFMTNISGIEPLTTNLFDFQVLGRQGPTFIKCFLKQYDNDEQPLLLLCENPEEDYLFSIDNQIILDKINYKYNFIISDNSFSQAIIVSGEGKKIFLNYPVTLNFTNKEFYTLEYFMEGSENFDGIKFVEDSPILNCTTEKYIKKCPVPISHFDGKESGYYYTYYSSKNATFISYDARPLKIILNKTVLIKIKFEDNNEPLNIGREVYDDWKRTEIYYPTISFKTAYNDTERNIFNISDIEEKTQIKIIFYQYQNPYMLNQLECRLWKPQNDNLRLICIVRYSLYSANYTFDRYVFEYNNQTIIIKTDDYFRLNYITNQLTFLYSNKQFIDFDNGEEVYYLKFKIGLYVNDGLFLNKGNNYIPLYDCQVEENNNKELTCKLNRSTIEENLIIQKGDFKLWTFNQFYGIVQLNAVFDININYNDIIEKEIITVNVGSNEEFYYKAGENTAYRTNSNLVPNIITDRFNMTFIDKFDNITEYPCYLKLSRKKNHLVLLCTITNEGEFYLLNQTLVLENIHYKYNFIINKERIDQIPINITGSGAQIFLTFPSSCDLVLEDSIILKYLMDDPFTERDVYLTQETYASKNDSVYCYNRYNVKLCLVPINFFQGKHSGYFYSYHLINSESSDISPYYEATPFYFTLPYENLILIKMEKYIEEGGSVFGKNGVLSFITTYNDSSNKIFDNETDLENFYFNTSITDENGEKFNITCRFWNPKNEFLRLFCKLHENLKGGSRLKIKTTKIPYKGYDILIHTNSYRESSQQSNDYEFPFLYSDRQTIEVSDEIDTYEIKFKILTTYNNEFIYLKNSKKYLILDNCKIINKELICTLSKTQIEKSIGTSKMQFKLNYYIEIKNDCYEFGSVLDIGIIMKEPSEKINIYINNLTLITNLSNYKSIVTYEVDFYSPSLDTLPDFITDTFDYNFENNKSTYPERFTCNFRKNPLKLLLTCYDYDSGYFRIGSIINQTFTNINYKYNFLFESVRNDELASVNWRLYLIDESYPNYANLSLKDYFTLILFSTSISGDIRLNLDSDNLECTGNYYFLSCKVTVNHFKNKKSGYYDIYALYSYNIWQTLYDAGPIYVQLPPEDTIVLRIKEENNKNGVKLGLNGTLYFVTDYIDIDNIFEDYIIEDFTFKVILFDNYGFDYEINCRFFNPINQNMRIFCDFDKKFASAEQNVSINTTSFIFKNYTVTIYSQDSIKVEQLNYNIPFLYSQPITINFNYSEYDERYYLKFNLGSYNGEKLILKGKNNNLILLDEVIIESDEIQCLIFKSQLQKLLTRNLEKFKLGAILDNYGTIYFDNVFPITLNCTTEERENITITSLKLLNNITEINSTYTYQTDVINVPEFTTRRKEGCLFKKRKNEPLLMICTPKEEGDFFHNITEEIYLYNIHHKYNILIKPLINEEVVNVSDSGTQIQMVYPSMFNMTMEDYSFIYYIMDSPELANNIKLNPDSNDALQCVNLIGMKKCTIPVEHFEGKLDGDYYTYHLNHFNEFSIYYEANPIHIILPKWKIKIEIGIEDKYNENIIKIGQKGVLYFVTDYNDKENIFDEQIPFKGEFTDSIENKKYDTDCILWKPKDENMRIICQLKENMAREEQNIYMIKTSFIYKEEYNITINYKAVNIKVKQLKSEISFLYYSNQEINIKDNEDKYELIFKKYKYDNRPLYLYKNDIRSVLLDNCKSQNNEVTCNLEKDKLLEILAYSGENYSLAEKLENEGLYIFNSVLNISFNYNIVQKDINIKIGNLLTPYKKKNEYIAYKATANNNITNILTTDYFELGTEKNTKMKCIFKKSFNQNELFLLCNALNDGKNSLGKIGPILFNNINIFYKFSIEQTENNEEFEVSSNEGTKITSLSPLTLNFKEKESYSIIYETEYPERLNGIKLNINSPFELNCTNKPWFKECIVNKDHFTKSGYYYTFHSNHKGSKTISYEAPLINVINQEQLEPEKDNDTNYGLIIGFSVAGVIIICLVIFLVWYYLKNKKGDKKDIGEDVDKGNLDKDEEKGLLNDMITSKGVNEEIRQSEANEYRINA